MAAEEAPLVLLGGRVLWTPAGSSGKLLSAKGGIFIIRLLVFVLLSASASAQGIPKLKVVSSTVDLESHRAVIELQNTGDKTVVAYSIELEQFDQNGKEIRDFIVNADHAYYNPTGEVTSMDAYQIAPGQSIRELPGTDSRTVSVGVSVLGYVYKDRASEGNASGIFAFRSVLSQRKKQQALQAKTEGDRQRLADEANFWRTQAVEARQ